MKIVIERTGGFAGITRRYTLDVQEEQLEALKSRTAKDAKGAKGAGSADEFRYAICLGEESFEVGEEAVREVLGRLK